MVVGPGIGQPDLAPLRHRRIEPKTGEERREPRIVRERRVCRSRRRGGRIEEPRSCRIHRHDVIVVVYDDDRVRHVPEDKVKTVALDPDLFLSALQPLTTTRQLLADVPDIGDVLEHGDGAAHANPEVRCGRGDDLVDELVALNRVDQGHLATGSRTNPLQVPGRERRREKEVVHPYGATFPGAVLVARPEEKLRAAVLKDHVVVRVRDQNRISDPVHHPPEPFLLDRVRFAGFAQEVDIPLQAERFLRLPCEGNECVDVVLRDAGRAGEKDDSSPLSAMLPPWRRAAFAIWPDRSALRRAPERGCDDGTELRLGEGLSDAW